MPKEDTVVGAVEMREVNFERDQNTSSSNNLIIRFRSQKQEIDY